MPFIQPEKTQWDQYLLSKGHLAKRSGQNNLFRLTKTYRIDQNLWKTFDKHQQQSWWLSNGKSVFISPPLDPPPQIHFWDGRSK